VLGEGGDRIMMDMLTDCAIFRPVNGERGNYYQLSGPPISDLELGHVPKEITSEAALAKPAFQQSSNLTSQEQTPCKIAFVRSRMLYAKAALNAKGGIRFGMRHIRQCALGEEDCTHD
jgi:telomerase reverse transcriptase